MKTKTILVLLAAMSVGETYAQKIDFNLPNKNDAQVLEPDFSGWAIGRQISDETSFLMSDNSSSIGILVESAPGLVGNAVNCNWWKDGCSKYSKLVSDGIYSVILDDQSNYTYSADQSMGLQFTIKGLPAGTHSITAYHNNTDGLTGEYPPIDVVVNGKTVQSGVAQTIRAQTEAQSGLSYATFTVGEGETVVVRYISKPESGKTYINNAVVVNALVFDRPNPLTTATTPYPENREFHADADGGSLVLTWTPAWTAKKHHLYVGTSETDLKKVAVLTDAQYKLSNVYSLDTYFWRVDEEDADGKIYEGDIWRFRPRKLAFPDAEGYGRFATGGRGGQVYHVTTLADNEEPGSFRYGITKLSGPRTIVFDVSGIIELKERLTCADEYVTIACQTAPAHGICFSNNPFGVGPESIVRFMRLRKGAGHTSDGIGMAGCDNSILDHASISWTIDEGFSSRNGHNITLQRTMIAEALGIANHQNYGAGTNHGYAATIGGDIATFHHNLLAHNYGRNWSLGGGLDGAGSYAGRLDIFNNVVYNWGARATDGGAHEVNFVGNYYRMGIDTSQKYLLRAQFEGTGSGTQSYYISGNIRENYNGTKTADKEGDTYRYELSGGQDYNWNAWVSEPFFPSYAKIESAEEAFKSVCSDVGATMPFFDAHDQRIISETVNKTYTYIGSKSKIRGQIDSEADCGGYEVYPEESRADSYDTDKDGIPDWFEEIVGTNPNVPNNNDDPDRDGWTQLEDFLEFISHPYLLMAPGEHETIDATKYFAGYVNSPSFTAVSNSGNVTAKVDGSKIIVEAGSASGIASVKMKVVDAEGSSYERLLNIAVGSSTADISIPTELSAVRIVSYKVYSAEGKLVFENNDAGGELINNLPMGGVKPNAIYLLKAVDTDGNEHTAKILAN